MGIASSFAHAFTDCRTTEMWLWRYRENPDGAYGYVAEQDGRIAAFCGATVHRAKLGDGEGRILAVRDTFSLPNIRALASGQKNIFSRTATAFFATTDFDFCVGFSADRHYRLGELTLGYHTFPGARWLSARLAPGGAHFAGVKPISTFDSGFDQLWQMRSPTIGLGIVRDGRFLSWRFDQRQGREYWCFAAHSPFQATPIGYVALTPANNGRAILVDACWPEQIQVAHHFWGHIQDWLIERSIHRVETFCLMSSYDWPLWQQLNFSPIERPLSTMPTFQLLGGRGSKEIVSNSYHLTLADSDLY